nr:hypothetical transcript [Hymenolepis microstoma]
MDWSQFLDPQILLGVGAFTLGAINAYRNRPQNRRDASDGANIAYPTTLERGSDLSTRPEPAKVHLIAIDGFIEDNEDLRARSSGENMTELTVVSDEIDQRLGTTQQEENIEGCLK